MKIAKQQAAREQKLRRKNLTKYVPNAASAVYKVLQSMSELPAVTLVTHLTTDRPITLYTCLCWRPSLSTQSSKNNGPVELRPLTHWPLPLSLATCRHSEYDRGLQRLQVSGSKHTLQGAVRAMRLCCECGQPGWCANRWARRGGGWSRRTTSWSRSSGRRWWRPRSRSA